MNNARRKLLKQAIELLDKADELILEVLDDERDSYDNLPEMLQSSERGEKISSNIDKLQNIYEEIDTYSTELGEL